MSQRSKESFNKKEMSSIPYHYNSSIYYGAQDVYSPTSQNTIPQHNTVSTSLFFLKKTVIFTPTLNILKANSHLVKTFYFLLDQFNKDAGDFASRGNWWKGKNYFCLTF